MSLTIRAPSAPNNFCWSDVKISAMNRHWLSSASVSNTSPQSSKEKEGGLRRAKRYDQGSFSKEGLIFIKSVFVFVFESIAGRASWLLCLDAAKRRKDSQFVERLAGESLCAAYVSSLEGGEQCLKRFLSSVCLILRAQRLGGYGTVTSLHPQDEPRRKTAWHICTHRPSVML